MADSIQKAAVTAQGSEARRPRRRGEGKGGRGTPPSPQQGTAVPCTPAEQVQAANISRRRVVKGLVSFIALTATGDIITACQSTPQPLPTPTARSSVSPTPTATQPTPSPTAAQPTPSPTMQPGTTLFVYRGHTIPVFDVAWSPDSRYIASVSSDFSSVSSVHIWNAITGQDSIIYKNGKVAEAPTVAWSPDGKRIASTQFNGYYNNPHYATQIWDPMTGRNLIAYALINEDTWAIAWSPDGTRIASATPDNVQVWNTSTGQRILSYPAQDVQPSYCVAWSPDGSTIASTALTHSLQFWDAATGQPLHYYPGEKSTSVAWSPDGKRVAYMSPYYPSGGGGSLTVRPATVQVRDANTGQLVLSYQGFLPLTGVAEQTVYGILHPHSVAWSPDSRYIVSASQHADIQVWDVITQKLVYTYREHSATVYAVAWSPDGTRIASASYDNTVRIWQAP